MRKQAGEGRGKLNESFNMIGVFEERSSTVFMTPS